MLKQTRSLVCQKNDKTNSGNGGYGKRAGLGNRKTSNQYDGRTQSQQRDNSSKQQPKKTKSAVPDMVCDKCHHTGHSVASCKSIYTKTGIFLGRGEPPSGHYWTKRNVVQEAFAKEVLKQKQASLVKKKPRPAQQKKKKSVQSLTVVEPQHRSVLENSEDDNLSDSESEFVVDERTVSIIADKTYLKTNPWDLDSLDLDLEQWRLSKVANGKRPLTQVAHSKDVELTYTSLNGPAPEPSANTQEQKNKRKNMVKR
jgi:hypothetical protein